MAKTKEENTIQETTTPEVYNCLRKEIITVKFLPKSTSMIKNPRHVLYGGLADNAKREFVVPRYASNGQYYNVLTNNEKACLERVMGLEDNALSIYKRDNNFWDDYKVVLTKDPLMLDLSNPNDYIKYKVLLLNNIYVAKSLAELEDRPRITYQFVLVSQNEQDKSELKEFNISSKAYMLLGQYRHDVETLRVLLEVLEGRAISNKVTEENAIARLNEYIKSNAKTFIKLAEDDLLPTKVLIKRAVEAHLISKKSNMYFLTATNEPLCNEGAESVLSVAAAYLADPKNSELLFSLQAKLNEK